jgi:hypothetical protein
VCSPGHRPRPSARSSWTEQVARLSELKNGKEEAQYVRS